jgi:beta-mannanase
VTPLLLLLALASPREALLARLAAAQQSERFLFGVENGTLWGTYLDGALVPTAEWFERTARAGKWTSDARAIAGDDPAVLGVGLDMLAFDPPAWKRSAIVAQAVARHAAAGGVVTLDWHAESCTADVPSQGLVATVDGVEIHASGGGTWFYAETGYTKPIASRADMPRSIACLCRLANEDDSWLRARVKHIGAVIRERGLAGLPLVIRPFHEHNGDWFWWGRPYWKCEGAVSGAAAYIKVFRTLVRALREEPGLENALFAYSPDRLASRSEREVLSPSERRLRDPVALARDLLRDRMVGELERHGLTDPEPEAKLAIAQVKTAADERRYVEERRRMYLDGYPGDDVVDVLGLDFYFPRTHPASALNVHQLALDLRVVEGEARARGKVAALTEVGTYRLPLFTAGRIISTAKDVQAAHDLLFDAADRRRFLTALGLTRVSDVTSAAPLRTPEGWFDRVLLPAAHGHVAYALVWQTYAPMYFVPYPSHPEAASFERFARDPATCFLADACGATDTAR